MFSRLVLVVVGWLATNAFAYAPIQWAKSPWKGFIITPKRFSGPFGGVSPQQLTLRKQIRNIEPGSLPHFAVKPDQSIAFGDLGCLEASGTSNADSVRLNRCTGGPFQKWVWFPGEQRRMMIQLQDTRKCLQAVDDASASTEAPIQLRDCEVGVSDSWRFEEPLLLATWGRNVAVASSFRYALSSLLLLVVLAAFGFTGGLIHWSGRRRAIATDSMVSNDGGGGLSLSVPLAQMACREAQTRSCQRSGRIFMGLTNAKNMVTEETDKAMPTLSSSERRLAQLRFGLQIDALSLDEAESLRHETAFLESWTFHRVMPETKRQVEHDIVENLLVVNKPFYVRIDLPKTRPTYSSTIGETSSACGDNSTSSTRNFPEEYTVADYVRMKYHPDKIRFCNQLDYATSGLMCIGLTKKVAGIVAQQFSLRDERNHKNSPTKKKYHAIVEGHVGADDDFEINLPLIDESETGFARRVALSTEAGQVAITGFKVLKRGYFKEGRHPVTLVECQLYTGRRHQIRVHLSHVGHPVLGDATYGNSKSKFFRMFLHAAELHFDALHLVYKAESGFGEYVLEHPDADSHEV